MPGANVVNRKWPLPWGDIAQNPFKTFEFRTENFYQRRLDILEQRQPIGTARDISRAGVQQVGIDAADLRLGQES